MLSLLALVLVMSQGSSALPRRPDLSSSGAGELTDEIRGDPWPVPSVSEFPDLFGQDYNLKSERGDERRRNQMDPEISEYEFEQDYHHQPPVEEDRRVDFDGNHRPIDGPENDVRDTEESAEGHENEKPTEDDGEKKEEDAKKEEDVDTTERPLHSGIIFDTPFFDIDQVTRYFKQLEKAVEQMFRQSVEEPKNGTYSDTTEEEVDIDGRKFVIHKSIVKSGDGDNNSSVIVQAIASVADENIEDSNRTKRSNWLSEPIQ